MSSRDSPALRDVMARAAATYGRVGPDFFSLAAAGLVASAELAARGRVLDLACGPGTVAAELSRQAGTDLRVVAVDVVQEMVVEARRRLGADATVAVMDAQALGLASETFDAVLCAAAIYQVADGSAAVAEMRRVLRPGGALGLGVFETPKSGWNGLAELYDKYLTALPAVGRQYDADALAALLDEAGMLEVRIATRPLDVTYDDAEAWLANAWSHGERRAFEAMDRETYRAFTQALPTSLEPAREPDGRLHWRATAVYAYATKSG
jgi:SAM-dependent methyltransferase